MKRRLNAGKRLGRPTDESFTALACLATLLARTLAACGSTAPASDSGAGTAGPAPSTKAPGAGAAFGSAVVGSTYWALPPSCGSVMVNGVAYQQCGSSWYMPQYVSTSVNDVALSPPR